MVTEPDAPPKILLVDDSALVRKAVRVALEQARVGEVFEVDGGASALQELARTEPDLVICDLEMPGIDGKKLLQIVRGGERHRCLPFLMLTSRDDVESKVRIFDAGANDFLTKPFHEAELLARVKVHLQLKQAQDELARKNKSLEKIAQTDALTQVANRRHLETVLKREMARALRYGTELTLIMLDVDHFKVINDRYGHVSGDEVLREVACRISEGIRSCDLAARYGGEEFCLLLPQTNQEGGLTVAERYRMSLQGSPISTSGGPVSVTSSFGVATYPAPCVSSMDDFFRLADDAMYKAKRSGRNRVVAGRSPILSPSKGPANDVDQPAAEQPAGLGVSGVGGK